MHGASTSTKSVDVELPQPSKAFDSATAGEVRDLYQAFVPRRASTGAPTGRRGPPSAEAVGYAGNLTDCLLVNKDGGDD